MVARRTYKDFQFIVTGGPGTIDDPENRTIIRKQAMKDVGVARRNRGGYGRANALSFSVFDSHLRGINDIAVDSMNARGTLANTISLVRSRLAAPPTTHLVTTVTASQKPNPLDDPSSLLASRAHVQPRIKSLAINPLSGYEALRALYRFDVTDLGLLANFHINTITMTELTRSPNLLATLLGDQTSSYLSFVPSRYSHTPYLAAVVDCVVAKASSVWYTPGAGVPVAVTKLYAKALRAVQKAVKDEKLSRDADLLCAVQMLKFYEILEPDRTSAYAHHVEGSAIVISHRSPSSFTTPYEQMLFLAHVGPAFSESFYRGEPCYLAQPKWLRLYDSLAEETPKLTDRSPLVIRIRKALLCSSGLFLDANKALNVDSQSDSGFLMTLELRIRAIHHDLLQCIEEYKTYFIRASSTSSEAVLADGPGAYGTALECLCIYKRILAALCETERLDLESECQELAAMILRPSGRPLAKHSWLYTDLEHGVARILQMTRSAWEEDVSGLGAREQRLASRTRWETFRRLMFDYCHVPDHMVPQCCESAAT